MEWLLAVAGLLSVAVVIGLVYRPFGDYMAWVYTSRKDWKLERGLYKAIGVDAKAEQTWRAYLRGVLLFSLVGVLLVYLLQRLQEWLPYSLGLTAPSEHLA